MPITAVLLAAGYATRLYPLTADRPKALLPLGQGVILDEVIRSLPGVPDLRQQLLVTNHRFAEPFREWQRARLSPLIRPGTAPPASGSPAERPRPPCPSAG